MKVMEFTGAQLDYWVARADGYASDQVEINEHGQCCIEINDGCGPDCPFRPSHSWKDGGPIIEREKIGVYFDDHDDPWSCWMAHSAKDGDVKSFGHQSLLVAAMRAFIANKFGNEVSDLTAPT